MFTGLIEEVGTVRRAQARAGGRDLAIVAPATAGRLAVGASVAVSGACLTVESLDGEVFVCHAGAETMACTTLEALQPGDRVNLEPALAVGAALGGHFVQGHVDCITRLRARRDEGTTTWLTFELPGRVARYVAQKGSIAVDGVSLTVAELGADAFSVAVIPHTLANTTLSDLVPGVAANIEVDILAKYVERIVAAQRAPASALTPELLREHGF